MNPGFMQGIATLLALGAFIGVLAWAWSSRRASDFEEAASLPLEEDHADERSEP